MLTDYIVVANLLQPGPGYGTTPQDDTAWTPAMNASNIPLLTPPPGKPASRHLSS